ncbi:MAG TPA: hypothetical protein VM219_01235 [Phycisphaerae bacterium]|nr:hypothetical protein [Phycisphaerae bacterium]
MGVLTDDMTRLHGEIVELHGSLEAFVEDVKNGVVTMQADFRKAHHQMAKRTAAERAAFVSDLTKQVAGMRKEFATDIAGAHQAWFGGTRRATAGGGRAAGRRSKAKAGAGTR